MAKFDARALDPGYAVFDVARCGIVRRQYVEIEKTPEFERITQMMIGDMRRSQKKNR